MHANQCSQPYVTNEILKPLVIKCQRAQRCSDELACQLLLIAKGLNHRYGFMADSDEFASECFARKGLKAVLKADPERNLFSFFTTTFMNVGRSIRTEHDKRAKADNTFRALLTAGGVEEQQEFESLSPAYKQLYNLIQRGKLKEAKSLAKKLIFDEPPQTIGVED